MSKIKLVGIDLAKHCYQICALDERGKVLYNRKYTAKKFAEAIQQLEPTEVAMEACGASHYWGLRLEALGHRVRLVPPQHAKAFRRVHKSDEHDALSIAEAAQRPNIHFVPIKTLTQQDLQMLGGLREQCVARRTALVNQARGYAREYGVSIPKSRCAFMAALPQAIEAADNALTPIAREALSAVYEEIKQVSCRIDDLLEQMTNLAKQDPAHQRLQTIPGVGPVLAPTLLAKLGHAQQFDSGRDCAAWVGLVPKQNSTGGKVQLGGISKNGDRLLRTLVIHGARTVVRWADKHTHAQSRWIKQLVERCGKNKATVALANKMMRMIWAVLTQGTTFDMGKAYRAQPARVN
jgi:transposase